MKWLVILALAGLGAGATAWAAEKLQPGDPAPPFELVGSDGKTHRLEDLTGRAVVIAWFPKAGTPG